jgi:hypothetical protein
VMIHVEPPSYVSPHISYEEEVESPVQ